MASTDELTGVLGKRTKFQQKEFSQLVVLAAGRPRHPPVSARPHDAAEAATEAMPATLPLNDDTLLERTEFTATSSASSPALTSIDPHDQPPLHPLDQSLLLALCLSINNTSPSHGLTAVQIAPFVTRVLENASNWSVHSMALLLRSRLEASRTRTVQRGLLQHQALVDQLARSDAAEQADGLERVRWTWGIDLPARWELERELARKLHTMGVTRSAMEIFERLEMWEDVVGCYSSLGRKDQGAELVRELLEGKRQETGVVMGKVARDGRREAKLWCLLGDLESEPAHWEHAWSVSSGSSSRAMRSLGAYHFSRGDFPKSQECLERALKINPLFVRSWFVLGCAAMQTEDWETAEHAFGRCVAIDEDDAEGWSNLASVHLRRPESAEETNGHGEPEGDEEEALKASRSGMKLPFSRRKAAFYCLKRAAQLNYDSWKIWTNYMVVAIDVGEFAEAARALGRVVERRGEQGLDLQVLQRLVAAAAVDPEEDGRANPNEGRGLRVWLTDLFDRILLVKCASSPRVFLLHAKLLSSSPSPSDADLDAAIDAYLSANRVGVAQNDAVETSLATFRDAYEIVQACVDALRSLGPRERKDGGLVRKDWKWQARSIVRGFLARTKGAFEDEDGWQALQAEVAELKA